MEEKRDFLQVELDKAQADLKEIIDNSPEAKAKRKIARIKSQIREKAAQKIRKELAKVDKQTAKASKKVEKFAKKRIDLLKEGSKWSKDKTHAWGVVQSLVAKANGLRAELKKLEMAEVEQSGGMTRTEAYEQSVKNLRKAPGGNKPISDIKAEDDETVRINLATRQVIK